ncbi:hypothetical protein ABT147_39755 [Streptomyces sp. NPDC001868]|uniref:hypothetical protein n=1 Tax=Streptomyces sp. NPDC001868 TaxID=3154401 RepID=UPI00332234A4
MKVELNPGSTGAHTIFDVPSFNFEAQKCEQLGTPFVLKAGDNLRPPAPATPGCANSCRS